MPDPGPISLLLLLISPAVGSFLGVLADRLPRGESVIHPRSACRGCAQRLRPAELVPVLSYLWQRGRCRRCGARIAPWHLWIELGAIGLAGLVVATGVSPVQMLLSAVLLWTLLALALSDILWLRLPDPLTGTVLVAALAQALLPGAAPGPDAALAGAGLGAGSFWLIRRGYRAVRGREGLGLGDVKLMAGLGALSGPLLLPHLVLLAAIGALAVAGLQRLRDSRALDPARALPFGAALAAAGMALWFWQQLIN